MNPRRTPEAEADRRRHVTVQIRRSGVVFEASPAALACVRREFDRRHVIRLPGLLEPSLLRTVQREVDRAQFYERVHKASGTESGMRPNATSVLLRLLANDQRLFQAVQAITGCGPIACFIGRAYRMLPGRGHHHGWHDDSARSRVIGMSINLGTEACRGGVLQLRDRESGRLLFEATDGDPGDGRLVRMAPYLEHGVTTVEGAVTRTVFTGWFCLRPDLRSSLIRALARWKAGRGKGAGRAARRVGTPLRAVTLGDRLNIPDEVVFPKIGDEIVVFNLATGSSYGLGAVGSRAWELLAEGKSLATVCGRLAGEYEVDRETLERDLLRLLQGLEARGLVDVLG